MPHTLRLFHGADCYASGSDIGFGFLRPERGAIGCSQNPDNVPPARTVQYSPLSAGSSGTEDRFYRVWEQIAELDPLDDLCLCSQDVDNGAGLSWELTLGAAGSATRSLSISFTKETRTEPQDTDGNALPDSWETGAALTSNATNLAPLGADPDRKDIFVHADYMRGCQPPPGWEQSAVALFARRGIALHVDSGPQSQLNADGSQCFPCAAELAPGRISTSAAPACRRARRARPASPPRRSAGARADLRRGAAVCRGQAGRPKGLPASAGGQGLEAPDPWAARHEARDHRPGKRTGRAGSAHSRQGGAGHLARSPSCHGSVRTD